MTQNTETTAPVLVLASGNAGKIREFQAMFAPLGVRVAGQKEYGVRSCDEPYGTFIENCLAKARHAAKETGLPAMADDSGLCVDALGGAPGVFSARFAGEDGDDAANNRLLIEKMTGKTDRRAHYTCVLAAVRSADDPEPLIAEGFWQGEIAEAPAGTARSSLPRRGPAASATTRIFTCLRKSAPLLNSLRKRRTRRATGARP